MSVPLDQNRPTVAVIFSRIGPYHYARLKAAGNKVQLSAIEISEVDATYAWDVVEGADCFARLALFPKIEASAVSARQMCDRLNEVLTQIRPKTVAISGWSDRFSLAALFWCLSNRVPAIVMSETTAWDDTRRWSKEFIKRRLMRLFSAAFAGGHPHADYLEALGMPRTAIALGYDAVDNDYFARAAAQAASLRSHASGLTPQVSGLTPQVSGLRSQPSPPLPRTPFFLASARFVEKKNLPRLLQSYARYRQLAEKLEIGNRKSEIWPLVLLGAGPLQSSILHLRSSLGLADCVHLPGFKQYSELPAFYARAGAFVHASTTEQWGLVVNEAMASGLPVLVSNRCGCAQDLVQDGVNGFTFDPYNVEQLAQLMMKISAFQPFRLSEFGLASQRIISAWGPDRFAAGLAEAVSVALKTPPPRARWFDRLLLRLLLLR